MVAVVFCAATKLVWLCLVLLGLLSFIFSRWVFVWVRILGIFSWTTLGGLMLIVSDVGTMRSSDRFYSC